jgi:KDO2-lipid IV(A) lauroyltransferase
VKKSKIPQSPAEARDSHLESVFWRKVLLWGLDTIPLRLQRTSMPLWSLFFYLQVPRIRRAIENNLERLLGIGTPQKQAMAFRTFTNYCHCLANAYRYHLGASPLMEAYPSGLDHLQRCVAQNRGVILVTGHLGNWHLGPHYLVRHGFPSVTVVMHEEPRRETQQIERRLRDSKIHVVYAGSSPLLSLELRSALQRGELVAFQMDRPSLAGGLRVACAGRTASFAAGPALLARACEVPVVPVFFPLQGDGVRIIVEPPLFIQRTANRRRDHLQLTTELATIYASIIQLYPDQWFNFYDFWGA